MTNGQVRTLLCLLEALVDELPDGVGKDHALYLYSEFEEQCR